MTTLGEGEAVTTTGENRTACPNCGRPQPTDSEWDTVPNGGRPDLCWDDPLDCSNYREETGNTELAALRAVAEASHAGLLALKRSMNEHECHNDDCSDRIEANLLEAALAEWEKVKP